MSKLANVLREIIQLGAAVAGSEETLIADAHEAIDDAWDNGKLSSHFTGLIGRGAKAALKKWAAEEIHERVVMEQSK